MAERKEVRAGIVGLGLVASAHVKGYESHPRAEVAAVCDLDIARAKAFAAEHGIKRVYATFEEMLRDRELNAIDVATPTYLHAAMTREAAEALKHVHCEKPFCRTVREGLDACAAARERGVRLLVGETYVFIASHQKARELIDAGEIGRPLQIRERHGAWHERQQARVYTGPAERSWRVDPVKSGGGRYPWIFDHAVHFFATAEYFMRETRVAEVYAVSSRDRGSVRRSGAKHDPYTLAEVDIPIITWRFEDPACQGVWMRAERLNGKYDFLRGFSTTIVGETGMIEVLGEGGHNLLWDGRQQHLILHREGKPVECFRFEEGGDEVWDSDICYYSKGHVNQVHHFVDCVLNDKPPRYSGEEGLHAVACTLAAIRSAMEDRQVRVSEIGPEFAAYGGSEIQS
jgi:predicted dehydrogenase